MKIIMKLGVLLLLSLLNNLEGVMDTTIIPGACYYKIHNTAMCEIHRRSHTSQKSPETCSDHDELAPLLQGNNSIVAFYNRSHQRIFLHNSSGKIPDNLYMVAEKKLDPSTKLKAVKGCFVNSEKHGRVFVLYDKNNNVLRPVLVIKRESKKREISVKTFIKKCEKYFDMSTFEGIEEEKE